MYDSNLLTKEQVLLLEKFAIQNSNMELYKLAHDFRAAISRVELLGKVLLKQVNGGVGV